MFPSKPVVHVIEDSFLPTAQVIELYDIPYIGFEIIGKDRPVGRFSFPYLPYVICSSLSLDDKTVWFPLPFFYDNRVQLKPDPVDFLSLPSPESEQVIIKSGASVGSDIEVLAMGLDGIYNLFGARPTIEAIAHKGMLAVVEEWVSKAE